MTGVTNLRSHRRQLIYYSRENDVRHPEFRFSKRFQNPFKFNLTESSVGPDLMTAGSNIDDNTYKLRIIESSKFILRVFFVILFSSLCFFEIVLNSHILFFRFFAVVTVLCLIFHRACVSHIVFMVLVILMLRLFSVVIAFVTYFFQWFLPSSSHC